MREKSSLFLLGLIVLLVSFVMFFSRQIFFYQYEPEYYENWYYHSQWNYPGSSRGISDGELYKFVGYRLVEGENTFNINYEVPPLGKYLYGLAEKTIGNPFLLSVGFYFFSALVLLFLLKELVDDRQLKLLGVLLFFSSPFVATQIRETMLDLPLMFFILVHAYFFVVYLSKGRIKSLIFAGVFLGLASAVKPPVYSLLILPLGLTMVFLFSERWDKIKNTVSYFGSTFAGYVLGYFCYFIKHPNPIPWLRLHRKPIEFYLSPSETKVDLFNQWRGIFANIYHGWWQPGQGMALGDWHPLLPIGVIIVFLFLIKFLLKKELKQVYLPSLVVIFLSVNTVISFWPRYLMPIIPLLVILVVVFLKKFPKLIFLLVLLNLPFLVQSMAPSKNPAGDSQAAARFISTRAHRELYRSLIPADKEETSEEDFIKIWEKFFDDFSVRFVEASPIEETKQNTAPVPIKFRIEYSTKYGPLVHEPVFNFVKVHNQWRLAWQWDYLWPGFDPQSEVVIKEGTIPLLRLKDGAGLVIAERKDWWQVYLVPRVMFDWTKHLASLSEVTGLSTMELDKIVKTAIPDHFPRFIGYLDSDLGLDSVEKAKTIPGVTLRKIPYPVTISESELIKDVSGQIEVLNQSRPELFYLQATGYLKSEEGEKSQIPFVQYSEQNVIVEIK
ncbi:MAG: glycosyltransferase family 39 protein [Patescibacteria group bacterium]